MNIDKLKLIIAVVIFGTIGILRRNISVTSSELAFFRALIGSVFILIWMKLSGLKMDMRKMKAKAPLLVLSGAVMGFNWICLFESYKYTSIAVSTVCYYMAPVMIIMVSPFILKEKVSMKKYLCVAVAMIGAALVSGIMQAETITPDQTKGIVLGLISAVMYATVMLINAKLSEVSAYDRTFTQLATACLTVGIYVLLTGGFHLEVTAGIDWLFILWVGIINTGWAYVLFFGSMDTIPAGTVAIYTYIDPVVAILLSILVLKEPASFVTLLGAALVIGSTVISERV